MATPVHSRIADLQHVDLDAFPDTCPICKSAITPQGLDYAFATEEWVEKPFLCPSRSCQHMFIAVFQRREWPGTSDPTRHYQLIGCLPNSFRSSGFSKTIESVSANFVRIHSQAEETESRGLDLISGPGFRKALEYLIKDYASQLHPNESDDIAKFPLAECIRRFIRNDRISAVAERAVWLGNDQTHYTRVWTDKDVNDLKALIRLTVHWIEMEELTKEVVTGMPNARKTKAGA
jgi:hypothetical protein